LKIVGEKKFNLPL